MLRRRRVQRLHLHHHPRTKTGAGILDQGRPLLPQTQLRVVVVVVVMMMVGNLHVVCHPPCVSTTGRELVVVWPVRLEHLHDVVMLSLKGNDHWRAV